MQLMEALNYHEALGGWRLQEVHLKMLMDIFPASQHILTCLVNRKQEKYSQSFHEQQRTLASICLTAEESSSCIEWRLPICDLAGRDAEATSIISSPASLLVKGLRRFELQMQYFGGRLAMFSPFYLLMEYTASLWAGLAPHPFVIVCLGELANAAGILCIQTDNLKKDMIPQSPLRNHNCRHAPLHRIPKPELLQLWSWKGYKWLS